MFLFNHKEEKPADILSAMENIIAKFGAKTLDRFLKKADVPLSYLSKTLELSTMECVVRPGVAFLS